MVDLPNNTDELSSDELERYHRQILLEEVGPQGQMVLKQSRIFIAGAGGLGSAIAFYLAAAGVGTLVIVDNDRVALSNLNRQILHGVPDLDRYKVDSAREKLARLNPHIKIETSTRTIDAQSAPQLAAGCNLVIDALDNVATRLIINKVAVDGKIPLVHGAIHGFEGRVLTVIPGQSACLACMRRPATEKPGTFPVLGTAPGLIGTLQATEAVKCLLNIGKLLSGRMIHFDGLTMTCKEFRVNMNPQCPHCGHMQQKERNPA
jgi:adenylyltransferase/sulfurtransferase